MTDATPRSLSAALLLGMLTLPIVFCWFFLRRGYTRSLRRTGFAYAIITIAVGVVGSLS